eukprot:6876003-Pyramimonas_sp.AAC.1
MERINNIKKRMARINMIKHAGGDGEKLRNTGLAAATAFGVGATGINNTMLAQAQAQCLVAAGPRPLAPHPPGPPRGKRASGPRLCGAVLSGGATPAPMRPWPASNS